MVALTRIYTRGGDRGRTSLGDGRRVAKHDLRVAAYGTVDELNASIGLARLRADGEIDRILARIQNDLFDLGADLCKPIELPENEKDGLDEALRVTDPQVDRLETEIDALNSQLAPLTSFVLPGGTETAAHLHVCRTICRRAERLVVKLAESEAINPAALRFLNRLSDHLFVLARHSNNRGECDVLWSPGENR